MSRLHNISNHVNVVILAPLIRITQASQFSVDIMSSFVLVLSTFVLVLTAIVTFWYYRRIKEVRAKYAEAKNVVGDVVVSFNKQLQSHEELLEKVSYRVEGFVGRSENIVVKVDELGKQTDGLASKLVGVSEVQNLLVKDIDDVKARLDSLKKAQEGVEKHFAETTEAKIEAAIPIKRERALEPLTDTELHVLEFIAEAGEKTAPEIRDLTKLTREHSARLVKKLYEDGYLERDITKTPYKYRVKDEMLKILRKSEASI